MECNINDIPLYYEECGAGRPILMLHGRPLDHRHMAGDFEPIFATRTNWRRIYPDLPGMGKTPAVDWLVNQDQMLAVLLQFIDTVIADEPFAVAGTSYGGYLARGLVHQRRSQLLGVMLTVPYITTDKQKLQLPSFQVRHEDSAFQAALLPTEQDLLQVVVKQDMELLSAFRENIAPAQAAANHDFIARLRENFLFSFDADVLPEPFPAPALILTGRGDHWCGYRESFRFLDNFPQATYAALDCAGHFLPTEQPELFRALAGEWLARVEEYAAKQEHA